MDEGHSASGRTIAFDRALTEATGGVNRGQVVNKQRIKHTISDEFCCFSEEKKKNDHITCWSKASAAHSHGDYDRRDSGSERVRKPTRSLHSLKAPVCRGNHDD